MSFFFFFQFHMRVPASVDQTKDFLQWSIVDNDEIAWLEIQIDRVFVYMVVSHGEMFDQTK